MWDNLMDLLLDSVYKGAIAGSFLSFTLSGVLISAAGKSSGLPPVESGELLALRLRLEHVSLLGMHFYFPKLEAFWKACPVHLTLHSTYKL